MLDWPGTAAFLASVDGSEGVQAAVATATVDIAPAALITWVATRPNYRRRGLGGLVTAAAANRGFEMGASAVVLQASPLGLPVYGRLGFRALNSTRSGSRRPTDSSGSSAAGPVAGRLAGGSPVESAPAKTATRFSPTPARPRSAACACDARTRPRADVAAAPSLSSGR